MSQATVAPVWKTVLLDSLGFVLLLWSIPAAILLVGTPIALAVAGAAAFLRGIVQP
jgi:hypothetical protein